MSIDISKSSLTTPPSSSAYRKRLAIAGLTLMLSGRAMTLLFIGRAGGNEIGDPPAAWLMPLVGDAIIGVSALLIVSLVWRAVGVLAWTTIVAWNVVAIWDALAAFSIHQSVPWPSFFMIEIFGSSMFFMASAMHAACIYLATRPDVRESFFRVHVRA